MAILKIVAAGALGFIAYRVWQRSQTGSRPAAILDDGHTTPPHGDPILVGARLEAEAASKPRPPAHSSRGFGEP
ncbi:MAG: hypothetical protein ACTH0Y_05540 [Luteimonas sp.]